MKYRTANISKRVFKKMIAVIDWYNSMPYWLHAGDRFHENVAEQLDAVLPTFAEVTADTHYNNMPVVIDGRLYVTLARTEDSIDDIKIELIPVG